MIGVLWWSVAHAGPSAIATGSMTLVSGPSAGSAEAPTLTDVVDTRGFWNPRLRAGLSVFATAPVTKKTMVGASWGFWRDHRFCDTCTAGAGPGWAGPELLGSTDLTLMLGTVTKVGKGAIRWAALATLPASRDAFVCNPLYGAPGASIAWLQPIAGSFLQTQVRASRPFHAFSAAPVGRCSPGLRGETEVDTLTGAVEPTPWDGARTVGANPTFSGSVSAAWFDAHNVWDGAPDWLTTQLTLGLNVQRNRVDPETEVDTLTGPASADRSRRPLLGSVPWSLGIGVHASKRLDVLFSASNQLPTWLADPGGTLRALPARTAVTLQARQSFGGRRPEDL